jgi:hypothetical protein
MPMAKHRRVSLEVSDRRRSRRGVAGARRPADVGWRVARPWTVAEAVSARDDRLLLNRENNIQLLVWIIAGAVIGGLASSRPTGGERWRYCGGHRGNVRGACS